MACNRPSERTCRPACVSRSSRSPLANAASIQTTPQFVSCPKLSALRCAYVVCGRIAGPFPPALAHRLLLPQRQRGPGVALWH